jgi:hypothetical protein
MEAEKKIDEIRQKLSSLQKNLLEVIWKHYQVKKEWPTLRELKSRFGIEEVKKAISTMGRGIGYDETGGSRWMRYRLTLLGVLLSENGKAFEKLLERFVEFQRQIFNDNPLKDLSTSQEIAKALELTSEETKLLGELLWIGNFGGGRNRENDEWTVNAMDETEFSNDSGNPVDKLVCKYYEPQNKAPVNLPFPTGPFSGDWQTPANQPQMSEIAVSLDRLRKKFPDATKLGFLIMPFEDDKPYTQIVEAIKRTAEKHGLNVVRADENEFHSHLWENVQTLLHGCAFGIAIYDRIRKEDPNPNVGLEVGYLMAMNKPVLLLKDKTANALQSDLAGRLYKNFDTHDPANTIPGQMTKWLEDNGIIIAKNS